MADIFKPRIIDFEDTQQLYSQVSETLAAAMEDYIAEFNICRLALCGGKTPLPIYEKLGSQAHLHWDRVELYQTDERFTTDQSLLNQVNIKAAFDPVMDVCKDMYFIDTSIPLQDSVARYNDIVDELEDPMFDIVVLGVGYDGHIASLFPLTDFSHTESRVVSTTAPSSADATDRISLTLETLLNSREVFVVLTGVEKSQVLVDMLEDELRPTEYPAKFLLAHPRLSIFRSV
jgi:6-phosphogluconolactonase